METETTRGARRRLLLMTCRSGHVFETADQYDDTPATLPRAVRLVTIDGFPGASDWSRSITAQLAGC